MSKASRIPTTIADIKGLSVEVETEHGTCWVWSGSTHPLGYGRYGAELAHRIAWQVHSGEHPGKKVVMHKCDNPPCVNPNHLQIGTQADNLRDMWAKGRGSHGERHRWARLTQKQAIEIISRRRRGVKLKTLAERFNVNVSTISRIANGVRWRALHEY